MLRPVLLKAAATALTLASTLASAVYVSAHLKNPAAPLHPSVLGARESASGASNGAVLVVGPPVQPSAEPPVASTYAS